MKKMMKAIAGITLCAVIVLSLAGCGGDGLSDRHLEMINSFVPDSRNVISLQVGEVDKPQASIWLASGMAKILSSDETVVTVTELGKVTAVGEGTAYVIIDAGVMYEIYRYNVEAPAKSNAETAPVETDAAETGEMETDIDEKEPAETESVEVSPTNNTVDYQKLIDSFVPNSFNVISLRVGEIDKPQASMWLESGMARIVSSDETVVTVTELGKVTAVGEGTAYVIIDAAGMYEIYRYDVSGEIGTDETEELVLAPSNNGIDYRELIENFVPDHFNVIKLSVGESNKPSASVWLMSGNGCVYSSNENVVTVTDLGKVTAVGEGSAYVVISAMNTMHQVYRVDVSS